VAGRPEAHEIITEQSARFITHGIAHAAVRHAGLTSDEDITVLNSSGFAIQDLYAARQLLERRIAT